jgi:competence protein ComFC
MILNKFKNTIFDSVCFLCNEKKLSNGINFICQKCLDTFNTCNENKCKICGHPVGSDNFCISCNNIDKIYYDSYNFIQYYTGFFKKIIKKWKMEEYFLINCLFVELLILKKMINNKIPVTVVPDNFLINFKKGRSGLGYLLKILEKKGYKIIKNIFQKKIVFIKKQKNKSREKRYKEIENVFFINKNNLNKYSGEIYLIDDIYTTGATLNYGAYLLKKAGFEKVHVISFFRSCLDFDNK